MWTRKTILAVALLIIVSLSAISSVSAAEPECYIVTLPAGAGPVFQGEPGNFYSTFNQYAVVNGNPEFVGPALNPLLEEYPPGELVTYYVLMYPGVAFLALNATDPQGFGIGVYVYAGNPQFNSATGGGTLAVDVGCSEWDLMGGSSGRSVGALVGIFDGRLNPRDLAALTAIYRNGAGYDIFSIDPSTGRGTLAFTVMLEAIDEAKKVAAETGEYQTLETFSANNIGFYVLPSGQCQLNYTSLDGFIRESLFSCGS